MRGFFSKCHLDIVKSVAIYAAAVLGFSYPTLCATGVAISPGTWTENIKVNLKEFNFLSLIIADNTSYQGEGHKSNEIEEF